jgi:hypothetical protein
MSALNTKPNLAKPDDVYDMLIRAHEGLSKPESDALNARLILIFANHIGDQSVIHDALKLARLETT